MKDTKEQDIYRIITRINKLNKSNLLQHGKHSIDDVKSYLAAQERKYCHTEFASDKERKNRTKRINVRQLIRPQPNPWGKYEARINATINGNSEYLTGRSFAIESHARKWQRELCNDLFTGGALTVDDTGSVSLSGKPIMKIAPVEPKPSNPVENKISERVLSIIEQSLEDANIEVRVKAYLEEEIPKALARHAPAIIKLHQNPQLVAEIKDMLSVGFTIQDLAKEHGVTELAIRNILQ